MNFYNNLKHDLNNGLLKNKKYFIIPFVTLFAFFQAFNYMSANYDKSDSFLNYILFPFLGLTEFVSDFTGSNHFEFPILWLVIVGLPGYITLDYLSEDMNNIGCQIIYRTKSRKLWWLSKVLWNVVSSIVYYLLVIIVLIILCLLFSIPLKVEYPLKIIEISYPFLELSLLESNVLDIGMFFLSPLLLIITMNLLQMTFSLIIKPVIAFSFTMTVYIISAFLTSPYLIGNYAMLLRCSFLGVSAIDVFTGLVIDLVISLILIVYGLYKIAHFDFIDTGRLR